MSDTVQPINPIFQDPADAMGNFFFIVFTSDPTRDRVKVWVDDGTVKLIMKRDKFYDLIARLIDHETSRRVHEACTTYGCFYALDRVNRELQKLHAASEHKHLNPAKDFMDKHNEIRKNSDSLEAQYADSLNKWTEDGFARSWLNDHNKKNDVENRII